MTYVLIQRARDGRERVLSLAFDTRPMTADEATRYVGEIIDNRNFRAKTAAVMLKAGRSYSASHGAWPDGAMWRIERVNQGGQA